MPTSPPNDTIGHGTYNQSGTYSTGIGNFNNLPAGISNAGGNTGNNAYTRAVMPNELVSNQLNGLLAGNSAYMQNARRSGMDMANSRGLLNSSMAAGNSQLAAINAGMPIAQADAGAYGAAAGQNLSALNTILANSQDNATSERNAAQAAGASIYNADQDYRLGMNTLGYNGQQAGLNRGFQDYMAQQGYRQQNQRDAFNLGGSLLLGDQSFTHGMYANNADNPFAINDPESFQGYIDFANQNSGSYYDNLFNYSTNGGQAAPNWQENSQWYSSPNYQQQPYPGYGGGR